MKRVDMRAALELKQRSVGEVLFRCARLWNERALAKINGEAGGPVLRPAHTTLLPHLGLEGIRLTELAMRLGVSKQAVGQLVDDLESRGVVERISDPSDRRAKLVRLTRFGVEAMQHGLGVLLDIERDLAGKIGRARMRELHATLRELVVLLETS